MNRGFLNISLGAAIAGVMIVVGVVSSSISHLIHPAAPAPITDGTVSTTTQTTTTNILPPNPLNNTVLPQATVQTPTTTTIAITTPSTTASGSVAPKDCGTDSGCLIATVQTCIPATATLTSTFDIFGITETVKNNYVVSGPGSNNTCMYSSTLASATITPDAAFKKQAAIHKTSLANIQSDLGPAQTTLSKTVGTITACSQPIATVTQVIAGFSKGDSASQYIDVNDPACTVTNPNTPVVPVVITQTPQ